MALSTVVLNLKGEYVKISKESGILEYLTKFFCTIAMHLNVYQEFLGGLVIMKFVSNHPDDFD